MPLVVSLSTVMPIAEKAQREHMEKRNQEVLAELRGTKPKIPGYQDKMMDRERLGIDPRLATELLAELDRRKQDDDGY